MEIAGDDVADWVYDIGEQNDDLLGSDVNLGEGIDYSNGVDASVVGACQVCVGSAV